MQYAYYVTGKVGPLSEERCMARNLEAMVYSVERSLGSCWSMGEMKPAKTLTMTGVGNITPHTSREMRKWDEHFADVA